MITVLAGGVAGGVARSGCPLHGCTARGQATALLQCFPAVLLAVEGRGGGPLT